ncbi:WD40 repeat domain-containing protein [Rhizobium sp. BR 317]|uniref:WD40 repeat domain-containing protein n=1 Tax=Rhizobium sp. BR 317 TaxID=3040015 RepID=UPI0039BEED89
MNQQTIPNVTLFSLLARNWGRPAPIRQLCFNGDDTALAICSADGAVALARLGDNEPPESRITIDNGQTTISPRQGNPSPLISTRIQEGDGLSAYRGDSFLVSTASGELLHLARSGEIESKVLSDRTPIDAFAHNPATDLTAVVVRRRLRLQSGEPPPSRDVELGDLAPRLVSISDDGALIALSGRDRLSVRRTADASKPLCEISLSSQPQSLKWSPDGRWLGIGQQTGGLCLLDVDGGESIAFSEFPGPIRSIDWSPTVNTVIASGAYRIAGWSMGTTLAKALATGRAGFVMVETVAAHPVKTLVAAGYANGRIAIAGIGSPDELTIRDSGGAVTALRWSASGRYLAAGDALGNAAIITFPNEIFK